MVRVYVYGLVSSLPKGDFATFLWKVRSRGGQAQQARQARNSGKEFRQGSKALAGAFRYLNDVLT